jgi:hypothetical protein
MFLWDERPHLEEEGKPAGKGDEGAVSFVVLCTSCGTKNKIWVTKVKKDTIVKHIAPRRNL